MEEAVPAALVSIFAIGGPVAIIIVAIVLYHQSRTKYYNTLLKALEVGKKTDEIIALFEAEKQKKQRNGKGWLITGIIVAGLGVGLLGMALVMNEIGLYSSSLLFMVMGMAFVLVYVFTKPRKKKEEI